MYGIVLLYSLDPLLNCSVNFWLLLVFLCEFSNGNRLECLGSLCALIAHLRQVSFLKVSSLGRDVRVRAWE